MPEFDRLLPLIVKAIESNGVHQAVDRKQPIANTCLDGVLQDWGVVREVVGCTIYAQKALLEKGEQRK